MLQFTYRICILIKGNFMDKNTFKKLESYMLKNCCEAHDKEHIYRVLYNALDIANHENNVDMDVLITACLLHDIGRSAEIKDKSIDHAEYGSKTAYDWLIKNGFDDEFSLKVGDCILCHRFRGNNIPNSVEAKVLYDADKLDAAGLIGVARTLVYKGAINEPIYTVENNVVQDGTKSKSESFFTEYIYRLSKIYDKMLTERGKELALKRKAEAEDFYNKLYGCLDDLYTNGNLLLDNYIK